MFILSINNSCNLTPVQGRDRHGLMIFTLSFNSSVSKPATDAVLQPSRASAAARDSHGSVLLEYTE